MKHFELGGWRAGADESRHPETCRARSRGPKNYQRADERIKDDVCERLTLDREVDATDIEVDVRESIVMLSGRVTARKMKHRAEDCAIDVNGVTDVKNDIRVVSETDSHILTTIATGVY